MTFSPQRVKFEFLSYFKEFGGPPDAWRVGCGSDAETALFAGNAVDREADIWLWKPTLSANAATLVCDFIRRQLRVPLAEGSSPGRIVYLYRKSRRDIAPPPGAASGSGQAASGSFS